jgi:hypothetical protein
MHLPEALVRRQLPNDSGPPGGNNGPNDDPTSQAGSSIGPRNTSIMPVCNAEASILYGLVLTVE